ncbi:unnamed protein product [Urochloa humidicola]
MWRMRSSTTTSVPTLLLDPGRRRLRHSLSSGQYAWTSCQHPAVHLPSATQIRRSLDSNGRAGRLLNPVDSQRGWPGRAARRSEAAGAGCGDSRTKRLAVGLQRARFRAELAALTTGGPVARMRREGCRPAARTVGSAGPSLGGCGSHAGLLSRWLQLSLASQRR